MEVIKAVAITERNVSRPFRYACVHGSPQESTPSAPSTTSVTQGDDSGGCGAGRGVYGAAPTGLQRAFGAPAGCPFGSRRTPGPLRPLGQETNGRAAPCPTSSPPRPTPVPPETPFPPTTGSGWSR